MRKLIICEVNKIKNSLIGFYLFGILVILVGCRPEKDLNNYRTRENEYTLISPYDKDYKYQYKVNLHAHSTARKETYAYSPRNLFETAKKFGFNAFAITDLPDAGGIVNDPGVEGIIHIPGIEYGGKPHIIGLGVTRFTKSLDKQEQIDNIKNQGGFAYIPHPYWGSYSEELISKLHNLDGIAVYNSLTYGVAVSKNSSSKVIPYNENLIDRFLSKGTHIAIIAEEDTKYEDPHIYGHQLNTAWINVWSNIPSTELTAVDIITAIKGERFTSHARFLRTSPNPPNFIDISTHGLLIKVRVDKNCDIEFVTTGGNVQRIFKDKRSGHYKASPGDRYVRVKATYKGNGSSWAWTNPIYINEQ